MVLNFVTGSPECIVVYPIKGFDIVALFRFASTQIIDCFSHRCEVASSTVFKCLSNSLSNKCDCFSISKYSSSPYSRSSPFHANKMQRSDHDSSSKNQGARLHFLKISSATPSITNRGLFCATPTYFALMCRHIGMYPTFANALATSNQA